MKRLDMSPEAVSARLKLASDLADLSPEKRLDAKLAMTPEGVTARLREASDLYNLCLKLGELGRQHR